MIRLHNRQSHAGPAKFAFTVQSLEDAKQLIPIFHVEPCAVITYIIDEFILGCLASHFDDCPLLLGCEFDRIGQAG